MIHRSARYDPGSSVDARRICRWVREICGVGEKQRAIPFKRDGSHCPGGGLFSTPVCTGSIVSAVAFHFRVRNGNGWVHHALTTKVRSIAHPSR